MESKGSINFKNGNSYSFEFNSFKIQIEKINSNIIRIWFTDKNRVTIPVPPNTFQKDGDTSFHNDFNGSFFMTFLDSTTIIQNDISLFKLTVQKKVFVDNSCVHWNVRNKLGVLKKHDGVSVESVVPIAII